MSSPHPRCNIDSPSVDPFDAARLVLLWSVPLRLILTLVTFCTRMCCGVVSVKGEKVALSGCEYGSHKYIDYEDFLYGK